MCQSCVADYMLDLASDEGVSAEQWESMVWPDSTPEMERLTAAIKRLYSFETCNVGGPLHVVTDDYNLEEDYLDFCERELAGHWAIDDAAPEHRDEIVSTAREIIALMRGMSIKERATALGRTDRMVPA